MLAGSQGPKGVLKTRTFPPSRGVAPGTGSLLQGQLGGGNRTTGQRNKEVRNLFKKAAGLLCWG